jgi:hypothetical protein
MFQAVKHPQVRLPNRGRNHCNAIYIDDLVDRLHEQLQTANRSPFKPQIMSNIHTTWREFLQFHADALRQKGHPVHTYQVEATNQNVYGESKLKDTIFKNSGAFPWKQILMPLMRRNRRRSENFDLNGPLQETPFAFSGTARMCQSYSHQAHSLHPMSVKPLGDWLNHFANSLS